MSEHGFDYIVGGIEDGIIAALSAALGVEADNGYVKTVASYGGELDSQKLREALNALTPRLPLMLVSYADGEDIEDPKTVPFAGAPRFYRHDCTFTVICCSADARSDKARRRGSGSSVGVYKMIADVRALLGGVRFTAIDGPETVRLNQEPFRYAGIEYLARLQELTAYAVHFDTYFRFSEPDRSQPGPLVEELVFTVENTFEKGDSNLPGVVLR